MSEQHLDSDDLSLPEQAVSIPTGAIAHVEVKRIESKKGIWVPVAALSPGSHGMWAAYVINKDEDGDPVVGRRYVQITHIEANRAYVTGTLKDGEQLILEGVHKLAVDQAVQATQVKDPWAVVTDDALTDR